MNVQVIANELAKQLNKEVESWFVEEGCLTVIFVNGGSVNTEL